MSARVLPAAGVFGAGAEWDHGILSVHRLVLTVRLSIHIARPRTRNHTKDVPALQANSLGQVN